MNFDDSKYPVSRERCAKCSVCSLVTTHISGAPMEQEEQYYQCLAMAESMCEEAYMEENRALASTLLGRLNFEPTRWKYPWLAEVVKLSLEYLTLEGLPDAMRASQIPDEILDVFPKN